MSVLNGLRWSVSAAQDCYFPDPFSRFSVEGRAVRSDHSETIWEARLAGLAFA
jgi:hypothetical protein